jgi:hypothetical protein
MSKKQIVSDNDGINEKAGNLRAEYAALSNYFNSLISFRLTLLGFYIAAIGFLVSSTWPIQFHVSVLGILLTLSLYLFELRTRILFQHLSKRAIEIEQIEWGFKEGELPFYSRQFPTFLELYDVKNDNDYYATPIKIFNKYPVKWKNISHSFALDLLYIGILIFFLFSITLSIINFFQTYPF